MTKKDYEKFADMLSAYVRASTIIEAPAFKFGFETATSNIIESVANVFAADNARFDKERFLKACGLEG